MGWVLPEYIIDFGSLLFYFSQYKIKIIQTKFGSVTYYILFVKLNSLKFLLSFMMIFSVNANSRSTHAMVITVRVSNQTQSTSPKCGQRIGLVGKSQHQYAEKIIFIQLNRNYRL